ncbi:MAG: Gfo/Idh/MocA family protein [Mucilaginibacter sp.]
MAIADPRSIEKPRDYKVYHDGNDLIGAPAINIVSIVTPPAFHTEMACAAMKARKHVLLEKPLATTEDCAMQIMATHEQTGMVITVDHTILYSPIIKTLMRIGCAGALFRKGKRPIKPLSDVVQKALLHDIYGNNIIMHLI